MPLLRKGVLIPSQGVDWSKPSTFIDDRSGFPKNMSLYRNEMRKRAGKTLYQDASMTGQVMGVSKLELPSLRYLVRASKTQLQKYNTATGAWDAIAVTPFTGGDDNFFSFANDPEDGLLLISNYVDKIRKWSGSGNNQALGGNPPLAKYLCYLSPYLLLGYVSQAGSVYPWKVQWCNTADIETWSGGNSGSQLLSDEPSDIQQLVKLNQYAAAYKKDSLWLGRKVETSDTFIFECIKTGIGLSAPRGVVDVEGIHYFMSMNDFHTWYGSQPVSIGASVRDQVFSKINRERMGRCFALHVQELAEVWFFIVVAGGEWPSEVWKYNYRTGFWYYDTCSNITCATKWARVDTESWDDDDEPWDSDLQPWDAGDTETVWEQVIFGDSSGRTSRLDYNITNDIDAVVEGLFETKDYVADQLEFRKRWLMLDVWARGPGRVYVDYSTDYGTNWTNIPYTSSQAYLDLDETTQRIRMYFDVEGEHIRFRFRNARSNEIFYLRNFYPYYILKGER